MFSLESVFPCLRHNKSSRTERLEKESIAQTVDISNKKELIRVSAVELEQTVREFLNDRQEFQAQRNER